MAKFFCHFMYSMFLYICLHFDIAFSWAKMLFYELQRRRNLKFGTFRNILFLLFFPVQSYFNLKVFYKFYSIWSMSLFHPFFHIFWCLDHFVRCIFFLRSLKYFKFHHLKINNTKKILRIHFETQTVEDTIVHLCFFFRYLLNFWNFAINLKKWSEHLVSWAIFLIFHWMPLLFTFHSSYFLLLHFGVLLFSYVACWIRLDGWYKLIVSTVALRPTSHTYKQRSNWNWINA